MQPEKKINPTHQLFNNLSFQAARKIQPDLLLRTADEVGRGNTEAIAEASKLVEGVLTQIRGVEGIRNRFSSDLQQIGFSEADVDQAIEDILLSSEKGRDEFVSANLKDQPFFDEGVPKQVAVKKSPVRSDSDQPVAEILTPEIASADDKIVSPSQVSPPPGPRILPGLTAEAEVVFQTDKLDPNQVTLLAQPLYENTGEQARRQMGIMISDSDRRALQDLVSPERVTHLNQLSSEDREEVVFGLVEKLIQFCNNQEQVLLDERGGDGFYLLNLLGPHLKSAQDVSKLIETLPFKDQIPNLTTLFDPRWLHQRRVSRQMTKKPSDAMLDRPVAGGDTALNQRQVNRFLRETSPSAQKRGVVSVEATRTRDLIDNLGDHIKFQSDQLLIVDKPSGVPERQDSSVSMGVLEAVSNRFRNQSWYLLPNLDRTASGLVIMTPDKILRDFWKGNQELGIDTDISFVYSVLMQGVQDQKKELKYYMTRIGGSREAQILKTPAERRAAGKVVSEIKLHLLPQYLYKNVIGHQVTEALITGMADTYQVRASLADIQHPVLGETVYSDRTLIPVARPMIHLQEVRLTHPKTKEVFPTITTGKPSDWMELINKRLVLERSLV